MTGIDGVCASYDLVAERYAEEDGEELPGRPIGRALYAAFAELVRELCGAGRPVGDVGCGPGHVSRHLAGLGWWDHEVDLEFHFLDPARVSAEVAAAGFTVMSVTERAAWAQVEAPTRRAYLLARRDGPAPG